MYYQNRSIQFYTYRSKISLKKIDNNFYETIAHYLTVRFWMKLKLKKI